ncbi:hypothetical protein [Cupriavidus pinatubonensis]|uniref:hypothetical protein n=1 Tax=Cupriavidus pinatubonensis TaxID=248026 RepID=UPI00112AD42B|nr:hypothetical protein [Cupriavidus pinatubonensis]
MDLREIQQLHARFARQPITIDMPARIGTGESLALPSPSQLRTAARQQWTALGQRTRVLALVFGIIGAAAVGGIFAAKMQHQWTGAADARRAADVADTSPPAAASVAPLPANGPVEAPAQPASSAPAASAKPSVEQEDPSPQQPVANQKGSGTGADASVRGTPPAAAPQRQPTAAPATASPANSQKAAPPHSAEVKMF